MSAAFCLTYKFIKLKYMLYDYGIYFVRILIPQGLKKGSCACAGQVDFLAGQVTFKAYLMPLVLLACLSA